MLERAVHAPARVLAGKLNSMQSAASILAITGQAVTNSQGPIPCKFKVGPQVVLLMLEPAVHIPTGIVGSSMEYTASTVVITG